MLENVRFTLEGFFAQVTLKFFPLVYGSMCFLYLCDKQNKNWSTEEEINGRNVKSNTKLFLTGNVSEQIWQVYGGPLHTASTTIGIS